MPWVVFILLSWVFLKAIMGPLLPKQSCLVKQHM
jgi:hypothetical protein